MGYPCNLYAMNIFNMNILILPLKYTQVIELADGFLLFIAEYQSMMQQNNATTLCLTIYLLKDIWVVPIYDLYQLGIFEFKIL